MTGAAPLRRLIPVAVLLAGCGITSSSPAPEAGTAEPRALDAASVDPAPPPVSRPDPAPAPGDAAPAPAEPPPADASAPADEPPPPPPSAPGQGHNAEGTIAFSNDFEQNLDGFTASPPTLPASRWTRVDDPLGQRGKVLQIVWMAGDEFKTSAGNKPRSNVSNTGYQPAVGTTLSYAWGYMITSLDINATFAQVIRSGGPIWMLEGHEQGDLIVRRGGGGGSTNLNYKLEVNRWYDFRVELKYATGAAGSMQVFINGQMVYEKIGLGLGDPPGQRIRWDGGIYNTQIGIANNRSRTVYISNLSIGTK
jgi:hypothetical protein